MPHYEQEIQTIVLLSRKFSHVTLANIDKTVLWRQPLTMCLYTYARWSHADKDSAAYLYLSSSWYLSGDRRVTGGVQSALY